MLKTVLKVESDLLLFIQHVRSTILLRWICWFVSRNPSSDVATLFNYLGFLVQLPSRGFRTTWILLLGVCMKGIVNFLGPKLPVPSQINRSIEMLTRPSTDIVSSESFFAACVFSEAAWVSYYFSLIPSTLTIISHSTSGKSKCCILFHLHRHSNFHRMHENISNESIPSSSSIGSFAGFSCHVQFPILLSEGLISIQRDRTFHFDDRNSHSMDPKY